MKAGYQKVPEKHRHDATKKKDEEERWPHTEPGRRRPSIKLHNDGLVKCPKKKAKHPEEFPYS